MKQIRNIESRMSLVERIERLDLSDSDRRNAVENALRAERVAEILCAISAAIRRTAEAAVKLVQRGAAAYRGHGRRARLHS